mmetsp:Transcript_43752/g.94263  ORF Transcript_43752/g.94263 Transcript_43752/m.94263 type:complete len:149 (+) Transcript_43752:205-651(+)
MTPEDDEGWVHRRKPNASRILSAQGEDEAKLVARGCRGGGTKGDTLHEYATKLLLRPLPLFPLSLSLSLSQPQSAEDRVRRCPVTLLGLANEEEEEEVVVEAEVEVEEGPVPSTERFWKVLSCEQTLVAAVLPAGCMHVGRQAGAWAF